MKSNCQCKPVTSSTIVNIYYLSKNNFNLSLNYSLKNVQYMKLIVMTENYLQIHGMYLNFYTLMHIFTSLFLSDYSINRILIVSICGQSPKSRLPICNLSYAVEETVSSNNCHFLVCVGTCLVYEHLWSSSRLIAKWCMMISDYQSHTMLEWSADAINLYNLYLLFIFQAPCYLDQQRKFGLRLCTLMFSWRHALFFHHG